MSFAEAARDEAERQQRIEAKLDRLLAELAALRASQSPRLVSPSEAAKALGVSIATCRRRIADGTLPARHVGRRVVVDLSGVRPAPAPAREARS
jgi:excisionase family DNA binding protein